MKGLILFLLVIIVSIMGYNQYQKYQRFHPKNVNYVSQDPIDNSYHDQKVVLNYYEAIEVLNGYVISQWSANRIDIRNPKKDNAATTYAVNEYHKKLGRVKYYESILQQSSAYKTRGLSNVEIRAMEQNSLTPEALAAYKQQKEFYTLFEKVVSKKSLKQGDHSPWVFELQKQLNTEGYNIPVDGKFRTKTADALEDFEFKNELYPDGILDVLTLKKLMKPETTVTKSLLAVK